MKTVMDKEFQVYGRVLKLDTTAFTAAINKHAPIAAGQVVYEPSVGEFEKLPLFRRLTEKVYGELPIEFGHCSGWNEKLNAVEYHRSSEVDIAATDLVLMVGRQQDIDYTNNTYDTAKIECFLVPAGTAVELYATTLHYAPCGVDGHEFRCGVVLPRSTNEPLVAAKTTDGEERLLFAVNKWLIAHKESGLEADGALIGLRGKNLSLK